MRYIQPVRLLAREHSANPTLNEAAGGVAVTLYADSMGLGFGKGVATMPFLGWSGMVRGRTERLWLLERT